MAQLRQQGSHFFYEREIGLQPRQQFRRNGRNVHRPPGHTLRKIIHHLLGDPDRDVFLRFRRLSADVRGTNKIVQG